ncbi:MAG TPA: aldolase/citrate lyase family protein [Bryobacteraceae bacterium]|nr:aldolase/citrate lyase family protein [Bryobacteraceae bacterium]
MQPSEQEQAHSDWENPVRKTLKEGKPVVGVTITVPSVELAANAANLGFDFLWIEMEHSPITLETARNMILATRGLKAVPFTRVPVNELWTAKRVLDSGSLGVMFPFTSTPELARQAVAACKYPPEGRRGSGPGLAAFRWPAPEGYHQFANRNVMVIVIIEQAQAVENVEEIAAIPGIEVLFIGTSDLSYSLGVGGQTDHPKVKEAVARVVAAGKRNNVPLGRPAPTADLMQKYMEEGFLFFQAPADLVIFSNGARQILQPLGKTGLDPRTRLLY